MKKNENIIEIDVDKIDLEEAKKKIAENPGLLAYAHTLGSIQVKPEDKGKIKGRAVAAMQDQTRKQMQQVYEQMQVLIKQAGEIKERVNVSNRIYTADMNFEPLIHQTYYLYKKSNGTDVLSLVAPHEWGRTKPFEAYIATVRMLADHTWEIMDTSDEF